MERFCLPVCYHLLCGCRCQHYLLLSFDVSIDQILYLAVGVKLVIVFEDHMPRTSERYHLDLAVKEGFSLSDFE